MTQSTIACIQLNTQNVMGENLMQLDRYIEKAVANGAQLVSTPECTPLMEASYQNLREHSPEEACHKALEICRELANKHRCWLHIGSVAVTSPGKDRLYNRTYLLDDSGNIVARYDKIHLFDADLATQSYRESERYMAGDSAVTVDTPFGRIGLSICYDLRFPYLYRSLAQSGAEIIMVPAAFAYETGMAHWHVLLRARAIENGCYIFAANQTGSHPGNRRTYGHSLIVDPWGKVLADAGEDTGIIMHTIDLEKLREIRRRLPCLNHDRIFTQLPDYQI